MKIKLAIPITSQFHTNESTLLPQADKQRITILQHCNSLLK